MTAKLNLIFIAGEKNRPDWPYINYDAHKRGDHIRTMLCQALPEVEFEAAYCTTVEDARKAMASRGETPADATLVVMLAIKPEVVRCCIDHSIEQTRPIVVADELYCGSGGFLNVMSQVEAEQLPVVGLSSSNADDLIKAARLLTSLARLRRSRALCITNEPTRWGPAAAGPVQDLFGLETIVVAPDELFARFEQSSEAEAKAFSDAWLDQAEAVLEPSREEVLKSARMYLALKAIATERQADAISVDCLSLFYGGGMPAYPCMSFFQLNNEGFVGVCEGDIASLLSQLLFRYLTGQAGYVSDPVLDTATNQIIYAHCVSTNRPFGPAGPACPYRIRSHAEDHKGAAIQAMLPLGQTVTTVAISARDRAMALHTARTVANINDERACRTKLAAESDVERIMKNWHFEYFGWHQVTCYGDWRREMKQIAKLMGIKVIEQDK